MEGGTLRSTCCCCQPILGIARRRIRTGTWRRYRSSCAALPSAPKRTLWEVRHDRHRPARRRFLPRAPRPRTRRQRQHLRLVRVCLQAAFELREQAPEDRAFEAGTGTDRRTAGGRLPEPSRDHAPQRRGSRNVRLAAIKSFMRFMDYRVPSALAQVQRVLAIPTKKTDSRLVRHLSNAEIQALLDAPDLSIGQVSETGRCCTCVSPPDCVSRNSLAFGWRTCRCTRMRPFWCEAKVAGNVACRYGSRLPRRCVPGWPFAAPLRFRRSSSTRDGRP